MKYSITSLEQELAMLDRMLAQKYEQELNEKRNKVYAELREARRNSHYNREDDEYDDDEY